LKLCRPGPAPPPQSGITPSPLSSHRSLPGGPPTPAAEPPALPLALPNAHCVFIGQALAPLSSLRGGGGLRPLGALIPGFLRRARSRARSGPGALPARPGRDAARAEPAVTAVPEMALSDSVTTCLSQPVHYAICKLGFEKKDTYDINNILSGNGEICWQAVTEHVCYLESDQSVDYIKSIRSLGPVCESVNVHFKSLTKEQFIIQYASWLHWTNCTEVFLEVFDVLQYAQTTEVALSLMKLTSCLERALGD
ncbi:endoplasmic reticulum membrane-associated RNA degradation protein-like, partial [Empidonax traillii]|uniref:endoplasmic reticulum membrane-associated RNA degradation protein-like n=1 Tax=Empidonax traillii TaxID=164674 RepID=UPI000FFD2D51